MKLILAAGHSRSGSTWLYNVLRYSYVNAGFTTYGAWVETYDPNVDADVHIVKTHEFNDRLFRKADLILTTRRDLRDVAASTLRKQWVGNTPSEIKDTMTSVVTKQYLPWKDHSDFEVDYEEMVQDKPAMIARILEVLRLDGLDAVTIHHDVDKLSLVVSPGVCPVSLLHPNHITNGKALSFRDTLYPNQIAALDALLPVYTDQPHTRILLGKLRQGFNRVFGEPGTPIPVGRLAFHFSHGPVQPVFQHPKYAKSKRKCRHV